jgi:hypothetical protein
MVTVVLEKETETFNKMLPQLLKDEGKFALIFGETLIGVFGTYEDALKGGYEKAKLQPFLVKRIAETENISYFSRDIENSCTAPF